MNIDTDNEDIEWRSKELYCISEDNIFYLKVPSFLSTYKLKYDVVVNHLILDLDAVSDDHIVQIPSVLIEQTLKVSDDINYYDDTDDIVKEAKILNIFEADLKFK